MKQHQVVGHCKKCGSPVVVVKNMPPVLCSRCTALACEKPAGENPDPPANSKPPAPPPPPLPTTAREANDLRVSQLNRIHSAVYEELIAASTELRALAITRAKVHVDNAINILKPKGT